MDNSSSEVLSSFVQGKLDERAAKVLKNTYLLLAMTLLFSAAMSGAAIVSGASGVVGLFSMMAALLVSWFILPRYQSSAAALPLAFLFTGLFGFGIGPVLGMYLGLANGLQIVSTALVGTGMIFVGLSAYVLVTKRNFSFLGGAIFIGVLAVIIVGLINIFLQLPLLSMSFSFAVIMLMGLAILFHTSEIIHGDETNYVMASIAIYVAIMNIFMSLLRLLGIFGGDD